MTDDFLPSAEEAVRLYNINNSRMTYRAVNGDVFDFKNAKALAADQAQCAHVAQGGDTWRLPMKELLRIAAESGDGYGGQHTGPRNG